MTTENAGHTGASRLWRFDLLINDLYDFYFVGRKRQWLINTLTLLTGAVYSTVGVIILRRPEEEVVWEAILVAFILLIYTPCVYVLRAGRSRQKVLG